VSVLRRTRSAAQCILGMGLFHCVDGVGGPCPLRESGLGDRDVLQGVCGGGGLGHRCLPLLSLDLQPLGCHCKFHKVVKML